MDALMDAADEMRERLAFWAEELSLRVEMAAEEIAWKVDDLRTALEIKFDEARKALESAGDRLLALWERAKEAISRGLEWARERLEEVPDHLVRYGAVAGGVAVATLVGSDPEAAQAAGQMLAQGVETAIQHAKDFVGGLPGAAEEAIREWEALKGAFKESFVEATETARAYWENFRSLVAGLKEMGVGEALQEAGQNVAEDLSKTATQVRLEALEESRQVLRDAPVKGDLEPF